MSAACFGVLFSDKGVLPDYIVQDGRVAIMDSEVFVQKEGPVAKYVWKDGVLKGEMLPRYEIPSQVVNQDVPVAEVLEDIPSSKQLDEKEDKLKRNIKGKPIPEGEVVRGDSVTENSIKDEMELWRGIQALADHTPTKAEEDEEINI